jgi:peptidoglycan/LPS O-acetylase OafA/YrhL
LGLIRLLLALSVVAEHFYSNRILKFVGGETAVESFFVISGFYMAMVIGQYQNKLDFWKSRYLRLFPVYFVCLTLTALAYFVGNKGLEYLNGLANLPLAASSFLMFTNLTMFFQDVVMFMGVDNASTYFTAYFSESSPQLYKFLLVPQGWSIGLEISFYLLVPFVLIRSNIWILALAISSLTIKCALNYLGYSDDPWTYRFFPSELSMFLMGSLAYKIYDRNSIFCKIRDYWILGYLILIALMFAYPYVGLDEQIKKYFFIVILLSVIGIVFDSTKSSNFDRFLGLLSYPVYCSHLLVLMVLSELKEIGSIYSTLSVFSLVLLVSLILYWFVEWPVDKYRLKYKKQLAFPN